MATLSLILFLVAILLAFFRKTNVGVVALAVGAIAVRLFGSTDKALMSGISASMFTTLVGITLLFALINSTGALELLARKIVSLSGKRIWLLPIALYIAGFVVAGVGPGAVPALAIIPALGVAVAIQVGYNPIMLGLIGECGLMAGRMTPITPEAAIITAAAEEAGLTNVMPVLLVGQSLVTITFAIVIFFIFKGHKVKATDEQVEALKNSEKFSGKQIIALCSILLMLILIIFCSVNIGIAAMSTACLLALLGIGDDGQAIKQLPWGTICMVLGVAALLGVVKEAGGIDLMSNSLAAVMNKTTATPFMGVSAGLLSLVSSALGVVYPTMMPMCADIAAQVGGVNPVALMAAVGVGGSLAGVSPMSTGGALIMGALGASKQMTKEEENKIFVQLLLLAAVGLLVIIIVSALTFNLIANAMYPMV